MARPLFFVHMPKTAGTTFRGMLSQQFGADAVYPERLLLDAAPGCWEAYTSTRRLLAEPDLERYRAITGHFPYGVVDLLPFEVRTITLLRSPVDRVVSQIANLQRLTTRAPDDQLAPEAIFEDDLVRSAMLANTQTRTLGLRPEDFGVDRPRSQQWSDEEKTEMEALRGTDRDAWELRRLDLMLIRAPFLCEALRNDAVATDHVMLKEAKRVLDEIDLVGVTPEMQQFSSRYEDLVGEPLPPVGRRNKSEQPPEISQSFRRKIAAVNDLDEELYEAAMDWRPRS